MNVRLVAYRNATTGATSESTYQLDLQEAPNISLNFQFADIKEPESRKASFSQTFKLPFTDNNNEFFQNWFNVNLSTLVFSTKKKFNAVLYVGTVPQFEGIIQLKAVYQKAQCYEVVLMSNTADLFTNIGTKKLRDVFKNEDGTYSAELNHTYNETNIKASWAGTSSAFVNSAGTALRDTTVNVQKVMYPLSVTVPNFYFNGTNTYLGMSDVSGADAPDYIVPITQFRPAIQIKTLLQLIIARAGFSYTSNFIDGAYFGKLFMTTCGQLGQPSAVEVENAAALDGFMSVGNSTQWGTYSLAAGFNTGLNCSYEPDWTQVPADTETAPSGYSTPIDTQGNWTAPYLFTKTEANMNNMKLRYVYKTTNVAPASSLTGFGCVDSNEGILWEMECRKTTGLNDPIVNYVTQQPSWTGSTSSGMVRYGLIEFDFDLNGLNVGESCYLLVRPRYFALVNNAATGEIIVGSSQCLPENNDSASSCATADFLFSSMYNEIRVDWIGYANNIYGQTVDVPMGIDEKITQKAFLKDIIERFNLVVIADPDNASNVIIEPYNDFIGSGDLKHWTDKLDLDKEILVKDTTSLQKQKVLFTDKDDNDLLNKSIREEANDYSVYGKIDIRETNNEFASGEMKNNPIFAPYINEKVFVNNDEDAPTLLPNVAVQYEFTYKQTESGFEDILERTQPKLFYYNGSPTTIPDISNYYMHSVNSGTGVITAHSFDNYPLCSPFELTPSAAGISTITDTTKSLYFNQNPPVCGQLSVFNYNPQSTLLLNSLYYVYWSQYLNSIYGESARIMECHLNLDAVDIFNFSFADEIFIKDTYWRVLNISNYQVGAKASTKVTLITVPETYDNTCTDCEYVVASTTQGNNTVGGFYLWVSSSTPTATPTFPAAYFASVECCECNNGTPLTFVNFSTYGAAGLYPCLANTGSLPIQIENVFNTRSIFSSGITRKIYSGKLNGLNKPLILGANTTKYTNPILPYSGDDVVIKYNTKLRSTSSLDGESHRIVLIGHTTGTTRGYAYPQGDSATKKLTIPINANVIIKVKGVVTVIGGTSGTYTVGTTEGFAYYTVFKSKEGEITQLGTAGGKSEFSLHEPALSSTCTLNIATSGNVLQFGLDDNQADTKRIWQLTADIDINRVYNMSSSFDDVDALYQNSGEILLQNGQNLIWN